MWRSRSHSSIMPTTLPFSSTGSCEMSYRRMRASTVESVSSGGGDGGALVVAQRSSSRKIACLRADISTASIQSSLNIFERYFVARCRRRRSPRIWRGLCRQCFSAAASQGFPLEEPCQCLPFSAARAPWRTRVAVSDAPRRDSPRHVGQWRNKVFANSLNQRSPRRGSVQFPGRPETDPAGSARTNSVCGECSANHACRPQRAA